MRQHSRTMPAPTLETQDSTLIVDVIPGRRYAYSIHCPGSFDGATLNVYALEDNSLDLLLASHTEPGGNEIVATTNGIRFVVSDAAPADIITIHICEITGK